MTIMIVLLTTCSVYRHLIISTKKTAFDNAGSGSGKYLAIITDSQSLVTLAALTPGSATDDSPIDKSSRRRLQYNWSQTHNLK